MSANVGAEGGLFLIVELLQRFAFYTGHGNCNLGCNIACLYYIQGIFHVWEKRIGVFFSDEEIG